jgi:ABC-type nitrate/sulfonate/bicarbonate transport system substrate-binding protein
MMQFRHARVLISVVATTLLVGACSSSATPVPSAAPVSVAPATSAPAASSAAPATVAPASASAPASAAASPSSAPTTAASGSAAAVSLPAPEKTSIKIGIATSGETSEFAENLAQQLGIYKKDGFTDVTVTGFQGDGQVIQALVAGALDMGVIGSSGAISSVPTDTPINIVAMNGTTITDGLYCGSKYKTAADIKGQQIAISTFGGTSNGSALILIAQLGLTTSDVTITQVGAQDARIAAVKSGSVACAPIDLSQDAAMQKAGLNKLTEESPSGKQWGRSGLAATKDYIAKNPNTVLDVTAAVLEAQNSMWLDPATAATNFASYAQMSASDATSQITSFIAIGDRGMGWTDDAFNFPKQTLVTVNPAMASVNVQDAYNKTILQKLYDMGFYTSINDPVKPF